MTLLQAGPYCDVCNNYILLDKSINPFTIGGQNLHAHDKCRELLESINPINKGNYATLPDGRLKEALRDIFEPKETTPND